MSRRTQTRYMLLPESNVVSYFRKNPGYNKAGQRWLALLLKVADGKSIEIFN